MDRRQFSTRGLLTLLIVALTGSAFKCSGGAQVTIYVRTITTFLNQIAGLLPDRAAAIAKIVKAAADFDVAYQRGDFANADSFFNTLELNLVAFTNDLGINVSNTVKTWISIIGATVTSIAVLLKEQVDKQPASAAMARTAKSAGAVERLASQASVDALYKAAKL